MSSVLKHRGLVPAQDKVPIPDVVFDRPQAPGQEGEEPEPVLEMRQVVPAPPPEPSPKPVVLSPAELASRYRDELDDLRRQAWEQGRRDALAEKRASLEQTLEEVDRTLAEMQRLQDEFITRYGETLKYTAIEIAEKMILQKIETDDAILLPLVMQTVSGVKTSGWMNVEIASRLERLVNAVRAELTAPKFQGKAEVTPLDCPDGTCRVVTIEGALDASIPTQAENLRRTFQSMDNE